MAVGGWARGGACPHRSRDRAGLPGIYRDSKFYCEGGGAMGLANSATNL